MAEHTPTPWHVVIDDSGHHVTSGFPSICAADELDLTIIHTNGFKQEYWGELPARKCIANAAFIVKAVNSHDDLKSSLAEMVGIYWGDGDGHEPPPACIQRALAVLASIKETV